ncbi:MAG: metallophosphoesterase family protein [Promethearchaeota archaeon]
MKMLHLTDIEGTIPKIPEEMLEEVEFTVISGDISRGLKDVERITEYFAKIRDSIPDIPIYFIPGNWDYDNIAEEFNGLPKNIIPIHNKYIKFGMKNGYFCYLIGFGGALPGFMNNFVRTEEEIKKALDHMFDEVTKEKKPEDTVILVTHNPPINSSLDLTFLKTHIGSISVREAVERYKPDICLCGHIHESTSIEIMGSTVCVNPGAGKSGNAAMLELDEKNKKIDVSIIKIQVER